MAVNFKFEGFGDIEKNLAKLAKLTQQRAVIRKAIDNSSKHIVTDARSRVRSQAVAQTIKSGGKLNKAQGKLDKQQRESKTEITRFIGSNHPLSHIIEFGTAPRLNSGKFKGTQHPGTSPQPFMRPAWENGKVKALNNLSGELRTLINKAVIRQARKNAKG